MPAIKWTGGKRSQAHLIYQEIPPHQRYFEPFLGGGAVLSLVAQPGAIAGDVYAPLIEFWTLLRDDPATLADYYATEWSRLQSNFPEHYYEVRSRFNANPNGLDLCFLTRTCVNGISRFNARGEFNNSLHVSRRGMEPRRFADVLVHWNRRVRDVEFLIGDYEVTLSDAQSGDFVYLDPPYAGNKQRYVCDLDLQRFFGVLESLNTRGVFWALSFDGSRGSLDLRHPVPCDLYRRHLTLLSGNSAVTKVLGGKIERVHESLYLNY